MKSMPILFLLIFFSCLISCGDVGLGATYEKYNLGVIGNDSLFCYQFGWGIDNAATIISTKRDVCLGFDTATDICTRGYTSVQYTHRGDTLSLFISAPFHFPSALKGKIIIREVGQTDWIMGLKDSVQKGLLHEVTWNKIHYDVPCWLVQDSLTKGMFRKER